MENPFLGASPDALVRCHCCGEGVVEVKCPYCARNTPLQEVCDFKPNFCLETNEDDSEKHLKKEHAYYYQCQLQMYCTRRNYCDFVSWTKEEIHIERIPFDELFMERTLDKAKIFHEKCVLPELLGKWFTRQEVKGIKT
jgi:hypothetical protein